jgi:hypothetical protein
LDQDHLAYLGQRETSLPDANRVCLNLRTKWQTALADIPATVAVVATMKILKVNGAISNTVVGNVQVATLAVTGPGFTGFRFHPLTRDLSGWWSIRLGGMVSGSAPVAICRFSGEVLEVAMTAEHDKKNDYVKREPAEISTSFQNYLVYRPTTGPVSL